MARKKNLKCINTPPVSEERLLAFLDGAPDPELAGHLRACERCAVELRAYAETESLLAILERHDCPTPMELADYAARRLPLPQYRALDQHLKTCVDCQAELTVARSFLNLPAQPNLGERMAQTIERTVDALRLRPLAPLAPVGTAVYRDAGEQIPQSFESEGVRVEISVAQIERGTRAVRGRVRQPSPLPIGWAGTSVHLSEPGQASTNQPTTGQLDSRGIFRFDTLAPGTYQITLAVPERPIILENVLIS